MKILLWVLVIILTLAVGLLLFIKFQPILTLAGGVEQSVQLQAVQGEDKQEDFDFCRERYDSFLQQDPDFPVAFVSACVSNLKNGNVGAFAALCGYEPYRELFLGQPDMTKQECTEYFRTMPDS